MPLCSGGVLFRVLRHHKKDVTFLHALIYEQATNLLLGLTFRYMHPVIHGERTEWALSTDRTLTAEWEGFHWEPQEPFQFESNRLLAGVDGTSCALRLA